MPRGVYDRKSKTEKADKAPVAKAKRGGRRKNGAGDVRALATEGLIASGTSLVTVIRETVDIEDAPELGRALAAYELAVKLHKIAG